MKLGDRLRQKSATSRRLFGDDDVRAANAEGLDVMDYLIKKDFEAQGLPWTRANYIRHAYGPPSAWPSPEDWVADEHEANLPDPLQDWSKGGP
jgi:hypothetical protein